MENYDSIKKDFLINLLELSSNSINSFSQTTLLIREKLLCFYVALWSINNEAQTMSLIAHNSAPEVIQKNDTNLFVHFLSESYTEKILDNLNEAGYYYIHKLEYCPYYKYYIGKEFVEVNKFGGCYAVDIPVHKRVQNREAKRNLLYIYPKENSPIDPELIKIIQTYFSLAIANFHILRKDRLTDEVIKLHNIKGDKDIGSILYPIITSLLKDHIKYEAGSAFIFDNHLNRLYLSATTGIEGEYKKEDIFYQLGEGITGKVAASKKHRILHSHINNINEYSGKYREIKQSRIQSTLFIPVISVVNDSILGVLRFVNRINPVSDVLDYFSTEDVEHISQVSYLIALYIEFDITEDLMAGFSKQLAHETITPAIGIRGAAERLNRFYRTNNSKLFKYLGDYTKLIYEYSQLQIAQSSNIIYAWQRRRNKSKRDLYETGNAVNLERTINKCKKLVFPLLRDLGLQFDNIILKGEFPNIYVDSYAFEAIFLNLLRNTIKYRDFNSSKSDFSVLITCNEIENYVLEGISLGKGFLVDFSDYGVGISEEEKDSIFLLGYRGKQILKTDIRGLGIGLTVCIRILHDFYCKIWVTNLSNPTTFRIFLPAVLLNNSYTKDSDWITVK